MTKLSFLSIFCHQVSASKTILPQKFWMCINICIYLAKFLNQVPGVKCGARKKILKKFRHQTKKVERFRHNSALRVTMNMKLSSYFLEFEGIFS